MNKEEFLNALEQRKEIKENLEGVIKGIAVPRLIFKWRTIVAEYQGAFDELHPYGWYDRCDKFIGILDSYFRSYEGNDICMHYVNDAKLAGWGAIRKGDESADIDITLRWYTGCGEYDEKVFTMSLEEIFCPQEEFKEFFDKERQRLDKKIAEYRADKEKKEQNETNEQVEADRQLYERLKEKFEGK